MNFDPPTRRQDSDEDDLAYHPNQDHLRSSFNSSKPSTSTRSEDTKFRAAKTKANLHYNQNIGRKQQQKYEYQMQQQPQVVQLNDILTPKVQSLLWKKEGNEEQGTKYLVKWQNRSYHRVSWKNKQELKQIGFELTSNTLKSLSNKMRKTRQLKLEQGLYFNPSFLIPDRILSSTQLFTSIHHKRANDIKGKWDQTILTVIQKLNNFVKDQCPYGVLLHQPYPEELQKASGIKNVENLGQISNKVYLGYYKTPKHFWSDVGVAINNFLKIYPSDKGDFHVVGQTMQQAAIFLYEQWYYLSLERFKHLKSECQILQAQRQKTNYSDLPIPTIEEKTDSPKTNQPSFSSFDIYNTNKASNSQVNINEIKNQNVEPLSDKTDSPLVIEQPQRMEVEDKLQNEFIVNIESQFCRQNIFLTQKIADIPKTSEELQLFNPGEYFLNWLHHEQTTHFQQQYNYQKLNRADMDQLDLNTQTNKLFYVKWKDMSYAEACWQTQKTFKSPKKIEQFKTHNKIPSKEVREQFEVNYKIQKFLQEYNTVMGQKKWSTRNSNVQKMQMKFYKLDVGRIKKAQSKQPRQYGGEDIPIFKNYRKLKDFQLQSLNWLIKSWYENRNTILADQMGLGKTVQTISFLYHLHSYQNVVGPFLVLAPLTTLPQWRRQIQEWTNFNCLLYYDEGRAEARSIIQQYQFCHLHTTKNGQVITSKIPKFHILLTNYELFINDFQTLSKIAFQHIVLDQAHRLKNVNSKTTVTLSKLPCCRKTLLTGTPIQNNTRQLWCLLHFIQPRKFMSQEQFLHEYGRLNTQDHVKEFKKMLKPYLLRRIKEDVETSIPKLSETIVDVQMSTRQKAYYRGLLQKNKVTVLKGLISANLNSLSTQLRKCCNHPFLISADVENQIKFGVQSVEEETDRFIKASGKTILLVKLLQKFKKEGKKVLIFSQFVILLELIKPYLQILGYNCQILIGSQSSSSRHQAINRFTHEKADIFLISTKAGGVGINLTAATEIIIYDSDWNPQNDIQATARAHRIGQKQQVNVYRLLIANSYESQMFQMSSRKLGLDKAIFTGGTFKSMGNFDQAEKQLTKDEIELLLKKGIIGFLHNELNEDEYFNQPIEDILSKNARKVEYALPQTSNTFSKTTFKSQTEEIGIDSPDFWVHAFKQIQTPLDRLMCKQDNLRDYNNIQKQQQLFLETYDLVVNLIRQKTEGKGFNAEDQNKMLRFLEAIYSERMINRQLRDIADQLSVQLQKPTRRIKVKREDILTIGKAVKNKTQKQEPVIIPKKKFVRQSELPETGLDIVPEQAFEQQEAQEHISSPQTIVTPKKQQKLEDDIQRLCHLCERPKCTIVCPGICNRSFHKKCFDLFQLGIKVSSSSSVLDEIKMDLDEWKRNRQTETLCVNCQDKNYTFKCSVCLLEGTFEQEVNGRSKRHKNKTVVKDKDDSSVYKCSKCSRFYHLSCLFSQPFMNKFADHAGKTIKTTSQISKVFRCPAHYCNSCYTHDPRSIKTKCYSCIRCCRTFHQRCLKQDDFVRIGLEGHYYICKSHLLSASEAIMLGTQIQQFRLSKNDRLVQKKKDKKKKREKADESFQLELVEQREKRQQKIAKKEQQQFQSGQSNQINGLRRSKRYKNSEPPEQLPLPVRDSRPKKSKTSKKQEEPIISQEEYSPETHRQSLQQEMNESDKLIKDQNELIESQKGNEMVPEIKESSESKNDLLSGSVSYNRSSDTDKGLNFSKSSKPKKEKKNQNVEQKNFTYQYSDFELTPLLLVDFATYDLPWCRYCGSRYAESFEIGPWSNKSTLCGHHHEQWKKDRLHLDKYKTEPRKPIKKQKENELRYLNEYAEKNNLTPIQAILELNLQLKQE